MTPRADALRVTVVHGSLETATYPVIVGHFRGGPLKGAEAFADARLDGVLSRYVDLGIYPEQSGEVAIVRPPRSATAWYPPGVYAIGLGNQGELTRTGLRRAVSRAVIRRGLQIYEEARTTGESGAFGVSAVLMGTFPVEGIPVDLAVAAITEGVLTANESFEAYEKAERKRRQANGATGPEPPQVRVRHLELIERIEDKAEVAAQAVARLEDLVDDHFDRRLLDPQGWIADVRDGAFPPGEAVDDIVNATRRLVITNASQSRHPVPGLPGPVAPAAPVAAGDDAPAVVELDFTMLGQRARAEGIRHRVDAAALECLIDRAITTTDSSAASARTLYELLVPQPLKEDLVSVGRLQVVLDDHTAAYPWEVLSAMTGDGTGAALLSKATGLLRQFRENQELRIAVRPSLGTNALVFGNPLAAGFPPLPGAEAEANAIKKQLGAAGFTVCDPLESSAASDGGDPTTQQAASILNALFAQDYRIVHIAAHGQVDPTGNATGVVIGDGVLLTGNTVRQLTVVPEVVFLNCCYLGRIGLNRLAAGVARELMAIGVRVVVAAGWPVDDAAALAFATTFYERLLGGSDFGTSVEKARDAARDAAEDSMTWGAYQCYGDPAYRLDVATLATPGGARRGSRSAPRGWRAPVSADELERFARRIAVEASDAGRGSGVPLERQRQSVLERVQMLEGATQGDGRNFRTPAVAQALAEAFSAVGQFDPAVYWLRRSVDLGAPLSVFENLANMEVRLAQVRARDAEPGDGERQVADTWEQLLATAAARLSTADAVYPTPSNRAIYGSLCKKQATLISDTDEVRSLVAEAASAYHMAAERRRNQGRKPDPYHLHNELQLAALARPDVDPSWEEALSQTAPPPPTANGLRDAQVPGDFWSRAGEADRALTRLVLGGPVAATDVADAYEQAFRTRSSWSQRNSSLVHLRDVLALVDHAPWPAERRDALRTGLRTVLDRLESWETRAPRRAAPAARRPRAERERDGAPSPVDHDRAASSATATSAPVNGGKRRPARPKAVDVRLELLPARHGDALWLEYGSGADAGRIVVDGGPREAWKEGLAPRLAQLRGRSRIDLAVCTHVDADHIDGMIRLLQHPDVDVAEVWFNGWRHLQEAGGVERGAVEGEILAMLAGKLGERWNASTDHHALVVPDDGDLPRLELPGGAVATLLSPRDTELTTLAKVWKRALDALHAMPGDAEEAVRLLEDRPSLQLRVTDRGQAPSRKPGSDQAPANGSSLAFLLEVGSHTLLLTGDAHADALEAGVGRLVRERGGKTLPVDVVKLAHHGSIGNVTPALLRLLDAGVFAVTTNGDKFGHPDPETIELLVQDGAARGRVPRILFSYRSKTTLPYAGRQDLEAIYPPTDAVAAVELGRGGLRVVGAKADGAPLATTGS